MYEPDFEYDPNLYELSDIVKAKTLTPSASERTPEHRSGTTAMDLSTESSINHSCFGNFSNSDDEAYPPMLIGGYGQKEGENLQGLLDSFQGNLISASIDYCTMTIGKKAIKRMKKKSELIEQGFPNGGFECSEKRATIGGHVWRRFKPRQEEKKCGFGFEYESWDGASDVGDSICRFLSGYDDTKPTRIDIAFDFSVSADYLSNHWLAVYEPEAKRLCPNRSIEYHGKNGIDTCYIGSRASVRQIRVYRKDFQDISVKALFGPVLRVELVLKEEHAVNWWKVYRQDKASSMRLAAAHIQELCGFKPMPDDLMEIPKILKSPEASIALKLLYAMTQNHALFWAVRSTPEGRQLYDRVQEYLHITAKRSTKYKINNYVKELESLSLDALEEHIHILIDDRSRIND